MYRPLTEPEGVPVVACSSATTVRSMKANGCCAGRVRPPLADLVGPMPYAVRQTFLDDPNAMHGLHRYWRSAFTEQISDELIDVDVDARLELHSPLSAMCSSTCTARPPGSRTETAFAPRRAQWDFDAIGQWADAAESDAHRLGPRAVGELEPI